MTEQELYDRAIGLLDNFQEESLIYLKSIPEQTDWEKLIVHGLFRQSTNLIHCLLANSERSKFQSPTYVTDIILVGSIGRIIRDICVNVMYLKTNVLTIEQMKACWEYQIVSQKIKTLHYAQGETIIDLEPFEKQKQALKEILDTIQFSDKQHQDSVYKGRNERALGLIQLATVKGFDHKYFQNEFVFFSQFAHSSAFANSYIKGDRIDLGLLAAIYDKLSVYFIALVTESIELLVPNHPQLKEVLAMYKEIVLNRWN